MLKPRTRMVIFTIFMISSMIASMTASMFSSVFGFVFSFVIFMFSMVIFSMFSRFTSVCIILVCTFLLIIFFSPQFVIISILFFFFLAKVLLVYLECEEVDFFLLYLLSLSKESLFFNKIEIKEMLYISIL